MITRSDKVDLGLDRTRIKDLRDAARQASTVDALLDRLFTPRLNHRWEIQILADEVGMGKTFVGLATAFSVLEAMQSGDSLDELRGCYQKILIITPTNSALFAKWCREVGEFVKRCVKPQFRDQAARWFAAARVERLDELTHELRRPRTGQRVIVASMSIFGGGRLHHYDVKRRHLLGTLFRYWGTRFKGANRERLLKGAPSTWQTNFKWLDDFTETEREQILFEQDELLVGLRQLDRQSDCVEAILETCKEIATPFVRNRDELFGNVERQLVGVYRELMSHLIGKALPLVIVDEAHNWKNGPTSGTNGYNGFVDLLGNRCRRLLMLTATPFQLRPEEILEILKVSDQLKVCPTDIDALTRRERLRRHREEIIRPILKDAADTSRRFTKAWSKLPLSVNTSMLDDAWASTAMCSARTELYEVAKQPGLASKEALERIIETAVSEADPEIRQLLREGLRLFVYNQDLSHEMGAIVIRHRRHTGHRWFRVGAEYQTSVDGARHRPDRHVLHAAPGVDVRGEGELPHYLLMRCVSEMKGGSGRSSLGSALTGCYSTLIDSSEGRAVKKRLAESNAGRAYLGLLMTLVSARRDPRHPKVREVVEAAVANWQAGEKTLIFCFRTNTAQRLYDIIEERISKELRKHRNRCMGGPESLKALRTRLTGRDRDLIGLGMDRVLWSTLWLSDTAEQSERLITPSDFELTDTELPQLAALALSHGVDLLSERVDRVFLHRSIEVLVSRRLLREAKPRGRLKDLLAVMSHETWVQGPYGLWSDDKQDDGGAETAQFDERGVHSIYEEVETASPSKVQQVALELAERRQRARKQGQTPVLDVYARGPSLWLGADPPEMWATRRDDLASAKIISEIHDQLFGLTLGTSGFDWESRRLAMQAIRRAVLRESVLLRLLPTKHDRDESGWGELLVHSFYGPMPGQSESMAHRLAVFLEDLLAASGDINDPLSARSALYSATLLRDQKFVALVSGGTDAQARERVFSGFNTPLLPEVLICTSVGQEGIDLHRHCRHVVHFDLAWNPAVMEQRTGRADRIGSKTFRERSFSAASSNSFLEIGVPYLAGTYDERMYEELRLRAQTFEVLTGGDLAAGEAEGYDDHKQADGSEVGLRFVPLPSSMVDAMRVSLHVWSDEDPKNVGPAST